MATAITESEHNWSSAPEADNERDNRECDTTDDSGNGQNSSEHNTTGMSSGIDCGEHDTTGMSSGMDCSEHDTTGMGNGIDCGEYNATGMSSGMDCSEHDTTGMSNGIDCGGHNTSGMCSGMDCSEHDTTGMSNGIDCGGHNTSGMCSGMDCSERGTSNGSDNGQDSSEQDTDDVGAHGDPDDHVDNGEDENENRDRSDGIQDKREDSSEPEPEPGPAARQSAEGPQGKEENGCSVTALDQGQTQCPKCSELFKNPKILPCAHVLCRSCVVVVLEEMRTAAGCPVCGYCIADPNDTNDRKSTEEIAEALKEDKSMEVLVDCATLLQQQRLCCVCDVHRALYVCLDCSDVMCGTCVVAHRKFFVTKDHQVEELSSLSPSGLAARRRPSSYVRDGSVLEMYCRDHQLAVTPKAVMREHRQCSEVNTLEEEAKDVDEALIELDAKLNASKSEVQEALSRLEIYQDEEKEKIWHSLARGETVCDQLQKAIADCRQKFKNQAEKAERSLNALVSERRRDLKRLEGKLTSHQELTQRVLGIGPCAEKIGMKEAVQVKVIESLDSCRPPPELPANAPPIIAIPLPLICRIRAATQNLSKVLSTEDLPEVSQAFQYGISCITHTTTEHEDTKTLLPWEYWLSGRPAPEPHSPSSNSHEENSADPHSPIVSGDVVCDLPSVSPSSSGSAVDPWHGPASPTETKPRRRRCSDDFKVDRGHPDEDIPWSLSAQASFQFHKNVGTNIALSNSNTTAHVQTPEAVGNGIILSCDPMKIGHLYEVRVGQVASSVCSEMSVGVCFKEDLDNLTLPHVAKGMHQNAVVISPRLDDSNREMCHTDPRRELRNIPAGRRVGILVDKNLCLHLYIDEKDCGTLAHVHRQPLYAMFELYFGIVEVQALPVREEC